MEISVKNIIGSSLCVDVSDGEKIYLLLKKALDSKQVVSLSFDGIDLIITAFLNVAIGQLFRDYSAQEINDNIKITNFDEKFQPTWDLVYNSAPEYYRNSKEYDANFTEVVEEADGNE